LVDDEFLPAQICGMTSKRIRGKFTSPSTNHFLENSWAKRSRHLYGKIGLQGKGMREAVETSSIVTN